MSATPGSRVDARTSRNRPRPIAAVLVVVTALMGALLPFTANAASAQTASPSATSPPTPPAAGRPAPDTTPPADHPMPSVPAPDADPAKILPTAPTVAAAPAGQEVVSLRTATSKTFVGDHPGELRTEVYTAPVHYKDAKGNWVDINTDLTPSKNGRRSQVANGLDVSLADSATDAALVSVGLDATHSLAFSLDGAAKATAKADAKSVTYAKVGKATDLKVTSRATGVKDELVLASPAAPDRFVFPLQLKGLTASIDTNGDVVYRDEAGIERARTPHGFMTDAKLDPTSGEAPMSTGVTYALIPWGKGSTGVALEVRLDRSWLNDPARQYPVTVDPQIANAASADDTYAMTGFYRDNSYDTELKVGTYDGGAHIGRSFMHFDTSAITGATVTHAEIHLAERWSWNCNYQPEPVWRVSAGWNGRAMPDWSNQPPTDPNPIVGGTFANAGCSNRLAVWDVTGTAAGWAANPSSNFGLSLRATNESDNNRWKKYASTEDGAPPALIVTYNHAPITPVSVSPANGAHIIGSTTTATATYADADGGSGQIAFGVWNASSQLVWSAWSPSVCSWCATSVSVPALADGWYFLQTIGYDGQAYSPAWSPQQWFFLDTLPAAIPTNITPAPGAYVASPATVSARYSHPYTWSGYVLFDLITSSGGQGPAVWSPLTCNGCTATVTLPAMAPGAYTLYVLASDGNASTWAPTQTLNIGTAPAAPTGLQAVAGALSALLTWTAPPSNGGPLTGYTLTATDTAGGAPIQSSCTGCTSPFTLGGLTAGHNYTFTAQAINAVGTGAASAPSNAISALLATVLTPTNVQAARGDTRATVTWTAPTVNVPGITGYTVTAYRASDNVQLGAAASTTATS